jgi:hypothetical protein
VKPAEYFELAFERYEEMRECCGATPTVMFRDGSATSQGFVGNPLVEYIADFELTANRALLKWPARAKFFRLHFLCGIDDLAAIAKHLEMDVDTAWKWKWMLQNCVGNELRKCGKIARKSGVFYFVRHQRRNV